MSDKQLLCIGDSLADIWPAGARRIIPHGEYFNYQYGGCGLTLQLNLVLNHYVQYPDVSKYIAVFQFSGYNRQDIILDDNFKSTMFPSERYEYQNALTGQNEYIAGETKRFNFTMYNDDSYPARVRNLVSLQCMLANLGANVYVFRGWLGVFPEELWKQCTRQYDMHGVKYSNMTLVETAASLSTEEDDWIDEFHPDQSISHPAFELIWNDMQ